MAIKDSHEDRKPVSEDDWNALLHGHELIAGQSDPHSDQWDATSHAHDKRQELADHGARGGVAGRSHDDRLINRDNIRYNNLVNLINQEMTWINEEIHAAREILEATKNAANEAGALTIKAVHDGVEQQFIVHTDENGYYYYDTPDGTRMTVSDSYVEHHPCFTPVAAEDKHKPEIVKIDEDMWRGNDKLKRVKQKLDALSPEDTAAVDSLKSAIAGSGSSSPPKTSAQVKLENTLQAIEKLASTDNTIGEGQLDWYLKKSGPAMRQEILAFIDQKGIGIDRADYSNMNVAHNTPQIFSGRPPAGQTIDPAARNLPVAENRVKPAADAIDPVLQTSHISPFNMAAGPTPVMAAASDPAMNSKLSIQTGT
jgi:hypothetical protein